MKKILLLVGILVAVLIAGAIAAPYFISGDTFKGRISQEAEKALGHKLTIGGKISVRFFPFAGATMENVILSGPVGDGDKTPLATLTSLSVDVELLPLLHSEVVVKSLVLDEPNIHLIVNAAGKNNWRFEPQGAKQSQLEFELVSSAVAAEDGDSALSVLRNLHLSGVKIKNGALSYRDMAKGGQWDVKALNAAIELAGLSSPFSVQGNAEWNKKTVKVDVQAGNLQAFLSDKTTSLKASIKSEPLNVEADGKITGQVFTGKASVSSPSLRDALPWIQRSAKLAITAPLAVDLASGVECSSSACSFNKATLTLDKIEAKGDVKVAFGGKIPKLDVKLSTGQLDLNPFLPPAQSASANPFVADAFAAAGWSSDPIDLSALRAFDANATIEAEGINIRKIVIGKTTLTAQLQGGRVAANIADADFYSGKASISLNVDASGAVPVMEKHVTVKGIQAEPFLKAAADSDRLKGTTDIVGNFSSRGKSEMEIISNLQGNGSVRVMDGELKGLNIADMVRNIQSAYKSVDTSSQKTDFAEMGGTFTIAQGIARNSDLGMKAPLMRLSGAGQVNLPQRTINYRLTPQFVDTLKGQGGKDKEGLGVPIIIEGSIDNPSYRPDLAGMINDALKDPEKLKSTVKDAKKQLKGLLKGF